MKEHSENSQKQNQQFSVRTNSKNCEKEPQWFNMRKFWEFWETRNQWFNMRANSDNCQKHKISNFHEAQKMVSLWRYLKVRFHYNYINSNIWLLIVFSRQIIMSKTTIRYTYLRLPGQLWLQSPQTAWSHWSVTSRHGPVPQHSPAGLFAAIEIICLMIKVQVWLFCTIEKMF